MQCACLSVCACVFAIEVCWKKMEGAEGHLLQKEKRRREKERVSRGDIKKVAVLCSPVFPWPLHHAQGNQWRHRSGGRGRLDRRELIQRELVWWGSSRAVRRTLVRRSTAIIRTISLWWLVKWRHTHSKVYVKTLSNSVGKRAIYKCIVSLTLFH